MSTLNFATTLLTPSFQRFGKRVTTQREQLRSTTAPSADLIKVETSGEGDAYVFESKVAQIVKGEQIFLPLTVEIRATSDYVSVTDLNTGIVGVGDSESEAKADFQQALLDYKDTLAAQDNLSKELRALLSYLVLIS
jgi:predicted RNase H-like HicB family nuclease